MQKKSIGALVVATGVAFSLGMHVARAATVVVSDEPSVALDVLSFTTTLLFAQVPYLLISTTHRHRFLSLFSLVQSSFQ